MEWTARDRYLRILCLEDWRDTMGETPIAVLGLGEAGSAFASDLIAAGAVWADMNTTAPTLKRRLSTLASVRGVAFADIAIMGAVAGRGLATPLLASGDGAPRAAIMLRAYGAYAEVLDGPAGAAAERVLLRSVFYKGISAAVVEALAAARALGLEDWLRDNIAQELANSSEESLDTIVSGTYRHAARRADEMEAAAAMLTDLGGEPDIARAAEVSLRRLCAGRG